MQTDLDLYEMYYVLLLCIILEQSYMYMYANHHLPFSQLMVVKLELIKSTQLMSQDLSYQHDPHITYLSHLILLLLLSILQTKKTQFLVSKRKIKGRAYLRTVRRNSCQSKEAPCS